MSTTQAKSATPATGFAALIALTGRLFFVIGMFARFPLAMLTVGIASFVTDVRAPISGNGAIAEGGLVAAAVGIGTAIGAPIGGSIADKHGQRPVLLATAIGGPILVLGLVYLTLTGSPLWLIQCVGFCAGAMAPQISALARARWLALTASLPGTVRQKQRNAAFGYESMIDEISFVFGPVIVGILAHTGLLWLPLVIAAVIAFSFTLLFAWHRTTAQTAAVHAADDATAARKRAVFLGPVMLVAGAMLFAGAFFGATLTSILEFSRLTLGQASLGGILYGVMGVSSALSAIMSSRLPTNITLMQRWLFSSLLMLVGSAALPFVSSLPMLLVALLVMGAGQGAALVSFFGVGAQLAPVGRVSLVMTLLGTMIVVGQALTSALAGEIAKTYSYHVSFGLVGLSVVVLLGLGLAVRGPAGIAERASHEAARPQ